MEINYRLGQFDLPYFYFLLDNGQYIKVNLAKYFWEYQVVRNKISDKIWDFTVIEDTDLSNIGNIKEFEYSKIRHVNACPNILKFRNITYRRSTQTELDKYLYKNDENNHNGKLYKYILDALVEDFNKKKQYQETIV